MDNSVDAMQEEGVSKDTQNLDAIKTIVQANVSKTQAKTRKRLTSTKEQINFAAGNRV